MGEVVQLPERVQPTEAMLAAEVLFDRQEIEATAWELIETRHRQPNIVVLRQEYMDNARTALMEALTASGHLSRVEVSGSLDEINQQVLNRLLNGWSDTLPSHEKERRFNELCEELIIQKTHAAIVAGELPPETAVAIISDCPVVEMPGIGYRYTNKKGMARSTHLEKQRGSYRRVIEQVSRSNSGSSTTFPFLQSCGIRPESDCASDIAAIRTPLVYSRRDYADGIVDIQRRLDYYAGEGVIYGDKQVDKPEHVAYEDLRQESARRESEIENYIERLAGVEEQLDKKVAEGLYSKADAIGIYQTNVHNILRTICMLAPDYAEATFGKAAAPNYYRVTAMVLAGQYEAAYKFLEANGHLEKPVTFCGMTLTVKEAKDLGLPVSETGELLKEGVENWKWKQGVCRVESCKTRPHKTEVGPCSVCKPCQEKFNKGKDPTKEVPKLVTADEEPKENPLTSIFAKEDSTIQAAA